MVYFNTICRDPYEKKNHHGNQRVRQNIRVLVTTAKLRGKLLLAAGVIKEKYINKQTAYWTLQYKQHCIIAEELCLSKLETETIIRLNYHIYLNTK